MSSSRLLVAAIVAFAVSRAAILFALEPDSWDTAVYFREATSAAPPYTHALPVEYPPVALWAMRAPVAAARRSPSLAQYRHAFRLEMALCDVAAFALIVAIARRRRPELVGAAAAAYVAVTAVLADLLYDRLDIALAALVLAWAYAFVRSRGSAAWTAGAYAALGLGASFKLVPLAVVPVLAAHELRDRRRLAVAAGAFAAAAALPFLPYLPGVLDVFRVHATRGIQIESVYASVAALAARLGVAVGVAPSAGSYNVVGPLAGALKPIATLAVLAVIALATRAAWRGRTLDAAYRCALLGLAAATVASNVLSPQYFLWALPAALLVALEVAPARFGFAAGWALVIAALTTWVFPYHYIPDVVPATQVGPLPETFAQVVIAARNSLYVGLVVWLARSSTRVAPQPPLAASASA